MTDDLPIRDPDQIRQGCARKLRAVEVSDHFQAILGCLLGEDWTTPRLAEMVITPDGHLLGRCDGESSFKAFLGASEDLLKNIHGVAPVAELDGDEIGYLVSKAGEISRAPVVAFITIHGIGTAKPGVIAHAMTTLLITPAFASIVSSHSVAEAFWADINVPAAIGTHVSSWGYGTAVRTLALSAHFCNADIGDRARRLFEWLLASATSLLAFALPFGVLSLCLKVGLALIPYGYDPLAGLWLYLCAAPVFVGICLFVVTPPIVAGVAMPGTRLEAALLSLRGIALSVFVQVGASLTALLVLSATRRWGLLILILATLCSWLLFVNAVISIFTSSCITILCVVCLLAWLASGTIGRLIVDIFRYIGDAGCRELIQSRVSETVSAVPVNVKCIIGHSLGGVIALDSLLNRDVWSTNDDVILITLGTPISRFFHRFFPGLFFPANTFQCFIEIQKRVRSLRWINVYRPLDYVGGRLHLPTTHCTSEHSTKQLLRSHTGYWTDSKVAEIIKNAYLAQVASRDEQQLCGPPVDVGPTVTRLRRGARLWAIFIVCLGILLTAGCAIGIVLVTIGRYWAAQEEVATLEKSGVDVECEVTATWELRPTPRILVVNTETTYTFVDNDGSRKVVIAKSHDFGESHLFRIDEARLAKDVADAGGQARYRARVDGDNPELFFIPGYVPTSWASFAAPMTLRIQWVLGIGVGLTLVAFLSTHWSLFVLGIARDQGDVGDSTNSKAQGFFQAKESESGEIE